MLRTDDDRIRLISANIDTVATTATMPETNSSRAGFGFLDTRVSCDIKNLLSEKVHSDQQTNEGKSKQRSAMVLGFHFRKTSG